MKRLRFISLVAAITSLLSTTIAVARPLPSSADRYQFLAGPDVIPVHSQGECLGTAPQHAVNNTFGTLSIVSGTGSFSGIGPSNKTVTVAPGTPLSGTISVNAVYQSSGNYVAPLIYASSWGDHTANWVLVATSVPPGMNTYSPTISLTAPWIARTFYLTFAYQLEIGGDHVASMTNWALGFDTWYDGNDVAEWTPTQEIDGQLYGCAIVQREVGKGSGCNGNICYPYYYVPADAITIRVR